MEFLSHPYKQIDSLLGDFYYGYLVPTVICGRTISFKRDISKFLTDWCDKIFDKNISKTIKEHPDFGLESLGTEFKERMFSKILVIGPRENLCDVWQILWGVWADVFKTSLYNKSKEYELVFKVSCIFLMFYLYFSQSGSHNLPIPLSLDTFQTSLELSELTLKKFKVTTVFNVIHYMFNQKCFTLSSYDGVQFLYQNKFGKPLKVVIGPPGSGKSTYCAAMNHKLNSNNRKCIIINLDPQVTLTELPYEPTIDVCSIIDSEKVAQKLDLGPNATLLYCMEYLLENIDWLLEEIAKNKNAYLLYDLPGQVELFIHHFALKEIIRRLEKENQRLVQVNLIDSTLCADPFKYMAALLSSLSSQIFIQLPHINVLSKLKLLKQFKRDMAYRLEYYKEVQDLDQLILVLKRGVYLPNSQKFEKFTATLCELIEDFNMVSFCTMDVEDQESVEMVLSKVDRAAGYIPFNEGNPYLDYKSSVFKNLTELEENLFDSED